MNVQNTIQRAHKRYKEYWTELQVCPTQWKNYENPTCRKERSNAGYLTARDFTYTISANRIYS
jgi:hypothetical protein